MSVIYSHFASLVSFATGNEELTPLIASLVRAATPGVGNLPALPCPGRGLCRPATSRYPSASRPGRGAASPFAPRTCSARRHGSPNAPASAKPPSAHTTDLPPPRNSPPASTRTSAAGAAARLASPRLAPAGEKGEPGLGPCALANAKRSGRPPGGCGLALRRWGGFYRHRFVAVNTGSTRSGTARTPSTHSRAFRFRHGLIP